MSIGFSQSGKPKSKSTRRVNKVEAQKYFEEKAAFVEQGLQEFVHSRFEDSLSEMAVYLAVGGKRLRGVMSLLTCEAVGGEPEEALVAACAVELSQAASLAKDDVMDRDDRRRGKPAFWKAFGIDLALLVPDVIVPHAALLTQTYGLRALRAVISSWAEVARGQLMDFPRAKIPLTKVKPEDYEKIISLKTAPLFEVACELGVRAAKKDWLVNLGRQYGFNLGMAFQITDDFCDLSQAEGKTWESVSRGDLPVSLASLKLKLGSGDTVSPEDPPRVIVLADQYLKAAVQAAKAFPETAVKKVLIEFPQFCCDALMKEAEEEKVEEASTPS